jgi:hypothetical protein
MAPEAFFNPLKPEGNKSNKIFLRHKKSPLRKQPWPS